VALSSQEAPFTSEIVGSIVSQRSYSHVNLRYRNVNLNTTGYRMSLFDLF
jgi:hypothetical protein